MDINSLVKITSRAWSMDILALMYVGTSGRQASLLSATGAGRTAFAQSLYHLVDLGLLERNPGHGHPLRPEFRLTQKGKAAAKIANRIKALPTQTSTRVLLRRRWTIPILVVSQSPRYFRDIKCDLMTITDRALSQSLKQLQSQQWLQRDVDVTSHPPRPLYQARGVGAKIGNVVRILKHIGVFY